MGPAGAGSRVSAERLELLLAETLAAAQIAQTERITGVPVECAYVDRGYRGHEADKGRVFVSGQKRGVTPTIQREIRWRAGIEPVIVHMKDDGYLGRHFLAGATGDAINVVLAAAGQNLRRTQRNSLRAKTDLFTADYLPVKA